MSIYTPPNTIVIPPTIPDSSNYSDNYSELLKVEKIESSVITDNTITMSSGMITNLTGPFLNNLDAVSIDYIKPASSGGVLYSLQYNQNGFFSGNSNLLFDNDLLTLNGNFTDGVCTITKTTAGNNIINDIINPINSTDIVSKYYADTFITNQNITINTNSTYLYTPATIINKYITRISTVNLSDQTDTAVNIIAYLNTLITLEVGVSFSFCIFNNGTGNISLLGGTGVSIIPTSFTIPPNYVFQSTIIITSSTTISIYIDNICNSTDYISSFFNNAYFYTQVPYKVKKIMLLPTINSVAETTTNYTYTLNDIKSSLIIRDPGANSSDTIVSSTIENCSFVIQNISSFTITLSPTLPWVFSTITIPANKTGYFYINNTSLITISII